MDKKYGVRQSYYSTGRVRARILSPSEVESFLQNYREEGFERLGDTLFYRSNRAADIYVDLLDTAEDARKFYDDTLAA